MSFVPSKIKNTDSLADFKNLTLRNGDLVVAHVDYVYVEYVGYLFTLSVF